MIGRVSWTAIDQALLGGSSFAANLCLARWLAPAEYGGYVAASAMFWIITSLHGGLLTEPMMVFGSSRFRDRLSPYLAILAVLHWCISAMISAGLACAGLALMLWASPASGSSVLGYALAAPGILLLWLLRRAFYVQMVPRLAAGASAIYTVGMLTIMYALYRSAALSSFTAPLSAAGASGLAVVRIISWQRFRLWSPWRGDFIKEVVDTHWRYGRWSVVTGILTAVPGSLYYLILPLFVGLNADGAMKALMLLVMPAAQTYTALTFLLIPAFARMRQRRRATSLLLKVLVVLCAGASIYALLMDQFGRPLIELLYQGRYMQYGDIVWLVGLVPLPMAAIATLGSVLRAYGRPDRVLWAYVISTVVTCVFGVAAVATWGLLGAILGLLASYTTTMLVMAWWVLHTETGSEPQAATTVS
ncbi:MAG: polysaccharide biosynthesis C-terminal domain-containing protein [Steroidobacteraceae bacterium]